MIVGLRHAVRSPNAFSKSLVENRAWWKLAWGRRQTHTPILSRGFFFSGSGDGSRDGRDDNTGNRKDDDQFSIAAEHSDDVAPGATMVHTGDEDTAPSVLGVGDHAPKIKQIIALPTMRRPLFPTSIQPLHVSDTATADALLRAQANGHSYVGVFLRRSAGETGNEEEVQSPELITSLDDIYTTGTFAQIQNIAQTPDGDHHQVFLMGHRRVDIQELIKQGPPAEVSVDHWGRLDYDVDSKVIKAYRNEIVNILREVVRMNPLFRESVQQISMFTQRIDMHDPFKLADFAAGLTTANGDELQRVLEQRDATERLSLALDLLARERELSKIQEEISRDVEQRISEGQRKYFLMEQHKQIKKELGLERDDKELLITRFKERLRVIKEEKNGSVPAEAETVINDEMEKLQGLEKGSSEFNLTRNYLDWLTAMPWGLHSEDSFNIGAAREILDADHYGLDDVKKRIMEFIAVGKLRGSVQGKIMCFVGPPGVGKTSIGKSIASALGREFYRFSVGGLSDVAAIKGHRRTYVGAMPGQLIQCLKTVGTANPLVLIDEVDKLGRGYQGDPASALLELLDPGQNHAFADHYLDVPVDLGKVLFICTANSLDTIPGPLLDRMEIIRVSGYDLPEKVEIAKRYLIPKAMEEAGLKRPNSEGDREKDSSGSSSTEDIRPDTELMDVPDVSIEDAAIEELIRRYCREAGVRNLEKQVDKICRKLALRAVEASDNPSSDADWVTVKMENLSDYVGKPIFTSDRLYEGTQLPPGVVMGLAWTAMGGSSLYIETSAVLRKAPKGDDEGATASTSGGGRFVTTGQMGSVMEESSRIATSVARKQLSLAPPGGITEDLSSWFDSADVHMHVPEGATPKDGPSAGVTMVTALISLASGVPCRSDVAMTGEVSLTGKVLPVGGIKEKTIAARRSGITTLIFPAANRADFDELPDYLKDGIDVHFASQYEDVKAVAFNGMQPNPL